MEDGQWFMPTASNAKKTAEMAQFDIFPGEALTDEDRINFSVSFAQERRALRNCRGRR